MQRSQRVLPRVYLYNVRSDASKNEIRRLVLEYTGVNRALKDIQVVRMDDGPSTPLHCSCFLKIDNVSCLISFIAFTCGILQVPGLTLT